MRMVAFISVLASMLVSAVPAWADSGEAPVETIGKVCTCTDRIGSVEINFYPDVALSGWKCAFLYRDFDGAILAWRYYDDPTMIPTYEAGSGVWIAKWCDGGHNRVLVADEAYITFTDYDVEARESREDLHRRMRRGLSPAPIAENPAPFEDPLAAP